MKTISEIPDLRITRAQLPEPVGLVPTMGFLHEGHISLVKQARKECASVVVTIFINPTQFGPNEDLESYPRDIPRDLNLLHTEGVDLVWMPTPEIMYPPDFQTWVIVDELTQVLEGSHRPGHFRGVSTVVTKLFNVVMPHVAFFGQKDAQQAIVIKQMVRDLNLPIEIIICPTIREADGLAMSSRNFYLNIEERQAAVVLSRALQVVKSSYEDGENDAALLRQIMSGEVKAEPLARLQYVSIANPETLLELDQVEDAALFSLAVFIGNTRLIDNFLLQNGQWMTELNRDRE